MTLAYTVALCTHNHADRLVRTLADLPRIRSPRENWELLIIDNASSDPTREVLARHVWPQGWDTRIVREERLGIASARNRAIQEARGKYLIFIDDDETADPDWLCAYERLIETHAPDAFGGRIEVLFEDPRPAWLSDELLGFLGKLDWSDQAMPLTLPSTPLYTGNFGFRLNLCDSVGRFDTALGRLGSENNGGEDVDFYRRLLRAGFKIWWAPEAVIHHRIQAVKLNRRYFLDLHYRQGRMEAIRERGTGSRLPPRYFYGQLLRACVAVWRDFRAGGRNATLRREMNVAYFLGQIIGWARGRPSP
ncbi:MAG: glycosyltransferase [Pseudomonadota bacterium]|nr:glycosyltransferase [Pseudomonadota bacterium]